MFHKGPLFPGPKEKASEAPHSVNITLKSEDGRGVVTDVKSQQMS